MSKPVHAAFLSITNAQRMNTGDALRMTRLQKAPFNRFMQQTGFHQTAATAHKADNGFVLNECRCLISRQELCFTHFTYP
jgi:hypothetical protein